VKRLKQAARQVAIGPALALGRLGFTPNALTVLGSLLTGCVGILVAQGWFVAAGLCLWLFAATDTLDGALARATNRVSVFGAFLDSVCDRYAEAGVFLGILWWYQSTNDRLGIVLTYVAAIGSLMVSYARARAEGIGLHAEVGWFQRPERIIVLGVGLLLTNWVPSALLAVLVVLAVLTNLTVIQRVVHVARLTRAARDPGLSA
jgi:CDP-diacylglycerol--glycerol-3-phosphate 3-phosphatidyltransferase